MPSSARAGSIEIRRRAGCPHPAAVGTSIAACRGRRPRRPACRHLRFWCKPSCNVRLRARGPSQSPAATALPEGAPRRCDAEGTGVADCHGRRRPRNDIDGNCHGLFGSWQSLVWAGHSTDLRDSAMGTRLIFLASSRQTRPPRTIVMPKASR